MKIISINKKNKLILLVVTMLYHRKLRLLFLLLQLLDLMFVFQQPKSEEIE
jgi:hypothetical protein